MIEVKDLVKSYGDKIAVNNISFTIKEGEIVGFLGPNGAGKSTTMNMLTGYISSNAGSIKINGADILEEPKKAKAFIGYLPEIPPLYIDMTVKEYLNFVYDLKKCKLPRRKHIEEVCELVKITDVSERVIKHLSKGYKQRVGIAQALINNPPVLILDEPTVGLDPNQVLEVRELINKLKKDHTIIFSSHILQEVSAVCDKIVIINKGEIKAVDTMENLSAGSDGKIKIIIKLGGSKDALETIRKCSDVASVEKGSDNSYTVVLNNEAARKALISTLTENDFEISEIQTVKMSLEEIFVKITQGNY